MWKRVERMNEKWCLCVCVCETSVWHFCAATDCISHMLWICACGYVGMRVYVVVESNQQYESRYIRICICVYVVEWIYCKRSFSIQFSCFHSLLFSLSSYFHLKFFRSSWWKGNHRNIFFCLRVGQWFASSTEGTAHTHTHLYVTTTIKYRLFFCFVSSCTLEQYWKPNTKILPL